MVMSRMPATFNSFDKMQTKARILALALLLYVGYVSVAAHAARTPLATRLNKHEKLIVFSFDGFRHDYLDKVATPNLKALRANGVSTKSMTPVFTSKTFVNHQSFVTGVYAETHGIVDNTVYDPLYGRELTGFADYADEFWNFDEDVVPIWIRNEWAGDGRISAVRFPGANQHYGPNRTLPTHFIDYDRNLPYQDRMDYVISWLTNETHPANLIFMYFDQPDYAGHEFGPDSPEVAYQITRMDNMTKYLVDRLVELDIFDQVNLMFWSDHGMQEANMANRINLTQVVNLPWNAHYDRYGETPVIQVQPKTGSETIVYEAFKDASIGRNFRVYHRSEIPHRWYYQNNRRIADIVVVADPGYAFEDWRSWDSSVDPAKKYGIHGYDNGIQTMRPYFIANGPRFKRNYEHSEFDSIDLFSLIANLMGIESAPTNGSFDRVRGLLSQDSSASSQLVATACAYPILVMIHTLTCCITIANKC